MPISVPRRGTKHQVGHQRGQMSPKRCAFSVSLKAGFTGKTRQMVAVDRKLDLGDICDALCSGIQKGSSSFVLFTIGDCHNDFEDRHICYSKT
jgi:hypothetical protein